MEGSAPAASRLSVCSSAGDRMMFVFLSEICCLALNEFVFLMIHSNQYGQLGLGDTNNRGDNSNEMGDYLPAVDYGSGFSASGIHIAGSLNYRFRCIFEDSSIDFKAKCFT